MQKSENEHFLSKNNPRSRIHSQISTPRPLWSQTPHWLYIVQCTLSSQILVALAITGIVYVEGCEEEPDDSLEEWKKEYQKMLVDDEDWGKNESQRPLYTWRSHCNTLRGHKPQHGSGLQISISFKSHPNRGSGFLVDFTFAKSRLFWDYTEIP